jgi:ABC-type transport system involved in cytochrome c biogenesis permease subunit
MSWSEFIWFAIPTMVLWLSAGTAVWFPKGRRAANLMMIAGILLAAAFIVGIWIGQGRPPLRTTGETRLWYSFFLSAVGFAAWRRYRYPWLLTFAAVMATVFTTINLLKPEIHSEGLMPALQSVWFVPHVTVYMLSYAMFAAATVGACIQLHNLSSGRPDGRLYDFTDGMVCAGFALLTMGMLMGMVWAKEAWGHYWTWDPKETWALATALAYLVYIHMRRRDIAPRTALWMLPVAFVLLMITWLGVNYLPAAQASIHVY